MIKCISPIDGSVYAERKVLTDMEANVAVERAKLAQKKWALLSLSERIKLVESGVCLLYTSPSPRDS